MVEMPFWAGPYQILLSCASFVGMAQAGLLHLSAGTLDLCLCVGSAQWVTAELLPLQWAAAGSVPQRVAAGSLPQCVVAGSHPAVSPSPLPAGSRLPSLTRSPQDYSCPPVLVNVAYVAVGRLPITLCLGQKYLRLTWRSSSSLSTPASAPAQLVQYVFVRLFKRLQFVATLLPSTHDSLLSELFFYLPVNRLIDVGFAQLHLDCFV